MGEEKGMGQCDYVSVYDEDTRCALRDGHDGAHDCMGPRPTPPPETTRGSREPHTPGPWKIEKPLSQVWTVGSPYGRGRMLLADMRGWGHLTGRGGGCAFDPDKAIAIQEANARLIAASPDLLEALEVLTANVQALPTLDLRDILSFSERVALEIAIEQARAAIAAARQEGEG